MRGKAMIVPILAVLLFSVGCQYYEDFRVKKATADLRHEQAELLRAYRLCLTQYQEQPGKSREYCAPYTQRLREVEISHPTSQ